MLVLGIETSCDETSSAVVAGNGCVLANVVSSQIELHKPYGGIVPEIASRNHLQLIDAVVDDALRRAHVRPQQLDGVAATYGPGLASALLVGMAAAKGLAYALGIPFLGVNHLEAHLFSPFLSAEEGWQKREPFISLIVSGGHTILAYVRDLDDYEVLGQTVDDAAGEAFDKVAKLLGLGYPGGPEVDRLAHLGNPAAVDFPRSMLDDPSFNFSFSGLKTSVRYLLQGVPKRSKDKKGERGKNRREPQELSPQQLADLCASFQEAVVDVLVSKTLRAAEEMGVHTIAVSGGVACNSRLRLKLLQACQAKNWRLRIAEPQLCTDNAAMIAALAVLKLRHGQRSEFSLDVQPSLAL